MAAAMREPMSVIDAAWLRMDRPTNLMMICGMMLFDGTLDPGDVRETIRTRLLCFHRFRQRVVCETRPYWEDDPYFDLDSHLRHIALPAGMQLEDTVSELISTPLDPGKPMWQFHLIDMADGNSALCLRIHHCYGDGFALMHVVDAMTDADPDRRKEPAPDVGGDEDRRGAWERILGPFSERLGDVLRATEAVAQGGMSIVLKPSQAAQYGLIGFGLAQEAVTIATMAPDSHTRFKGPLGIMKRAAWTPSSLLLNEVKAVAAVFGCSVNDVMLACVAGALRSYLRDQGDPVDNIEMRVLVPVNLRPPGRFGELGNAFGLVFFSLPLGIEDPYARLLEVHKRMNALKRSRQARVALGILASMGVLPEAMKERVLEALAANASAVVTNVRGFEENRYFAGREIVRQVFWVPQSGGIGMGISILSYADKVDFGVVADIQRISNPDAIISRFRDEFELMLYGVLLAPWPQDARKSDAVMRKEPARKPGPQRRNSMC